MRDRVSGRLMDDATPVHTFVSPEEEHAGALLLTYPFAEAYAVWRRLERCKAALVFAALTTLAAERKGGAGADFLADRLVADLGCHFARNVASAYRPEGT